MTTNAACGATLNTTSQILVVDDTPEALMATSGVLRAGGYDVREAASGAECLEAARAAPPDLILLDVVLPDIDGPEVCRRIKADPALRGTFVVLMSSRRVTSESQAEGLEGGADGYIPRPIPSKELLARVLSILRIKWAAEALRQANEALETRVRERTAELTEANSRLAAEVEQRTQAQLALEQAMAEVQNLKNQLQEENVYLRDEVKVLHGHAQIAGRSEAICASLRHAEQVAPTGATVLLLGETGTGKELFASAIHDLSPRRGRAMVRVNCAAIPHTLIESELFGREKGAYTGALSKQVGRFELANGSTLFLDEIGDLPLEVQVKLLRVLQEKQIERLGSPNPIPVDVRIITATNQNLEQAVASGRFRQDLFYRLNVFPITVPPLRERREDIPLLVWAFVEQFTKTMGRSIESIPESSMDALMRHSWPGNVRELRNVVERAMILSSGPKLKIEAPGASAPPPRPPRNLKMEDAERDHILAVLGETGWRIRGAGGAAEVLGMNPTTLESRMGRLGICRPEK